MVWHCPLQILVSLFGYPEIRNKIGLISPFNRPKETTNSLTRCLLRVNSVGVFMEKSVNSAQIISNPAFSSDSESCPAVILNVDY